MTELKPCPKCGSINLHRYAALREIACNDCSERRSDSDWQAHRPVEDSLRAELSAALARAEKAEAERDIAIGVVENIQGKVAMYAGKYETEKKAREKAEAERNALVKRMVKAPGTE